jgi:hypothetical protein
VIISDSFEGGVGHRRKDVEQGSLYRGHLFLSSNMYNPKP